MRNVELGVGVITALIITAGGVVGGAPFVFADRVVPFLQLETTPLAGFHYDQLPGVIRQYDQGLQRRDVTLLLKDQQVKRSLGELAVHVDVDATARRIQSTSWLDMMQGERKARPALTIDMAHLQEAAQQAFGGQMTAPHNATLQLMPSGALGLVASTSGEGVDIVTFERDLVTTMRRGTWSEPIALFLIVSPAAIQDHEVTRAREFAQQILRDGVTLTFEERSWRLLPTTARRLLQFTEVPDPADAGNTILGVTLDEAGLADYLTTTIAPDVGTYAQDARFEVNDEGRVTQFALPQRGQALDIDASSRHIRGRVAAWAGTVPLAVTITEPTVSTVEDIAALGISQLLTTGESDFAGSPRNRIHNINVGTARYHGLLIPPNTEFSFNEFLGPVDAAAGFKPELVIKHNVTTPEFGGGLCQVSTTMFRAAVQAGLEVTARRNHAYAVRYYGKPGFDATIYPPYTDLRFTNNTPGYLLVQARVDGTKLLFELWGSDDGRTVELEGPVTYDRQANGAVKARLIQRVSKEGTLLIDKTFYSRYQSPDLFPKVAAANDPKPTPTPTPTP